MCEGVFKQVEMDEEKYKVSREVDGFHFCIRQLKSTNKIVLELIIPKKNGIDEKRIEFEKLLPEWVLENVSIDLETAISIAHNNRDSKDVIESMLFEVVDQFEKLLSLEIGEEPADRIYFTVRYKDQKVSVWDSALPEEELVGFIDRREEFKEGTSQ